MSIVQGDDKKLKKTERADPESKQIFVDDLQKISIVLISLNLFLNSLNNTKEGKKERENGIAKIGEQLENRPMALLIGHRLGVFCLWTCKIGQRRVVIKALILDNFLAFTHGKKICG